MGLLLSIWHFLYVCLQFLYTYTVKCAITASTSFPDLFSIEHSITSAIEEVLLNNLGNYGN
jgi:hypothetical protein